MKKLVLIIIMLMITTSLMAIRKTTILEHEINNSKITKIEVNDKKLGTVEEIKIELGEMSIQKIYSDDNLRFGIMGYKYFINKKQILKSDTKLFAMGVMYEITQAFGISIISRLQIGEDGYEPEAYFKVDKEIDKKDYYRIEAISNEIAEKEYIEILNNINNLIGLASIPINLRNQ
ncbi:MAG: hypothetical protein ACRDAS_10780 [Cetobacterium sp.]